MYALASIARTAFVIAVDVGTGAGVAVHALPQYRRITRGIWMTAPLLSLNFAGAPPPAGATSVART